MDLKLPYGLRDGELLTIDDVDSGLTCNCVCPHCKERLIARKGQRNEHHFAHYKVSDCGRAIETITHKLSKDFIKDAKYFVTPPVLFPRTIVPIIDEAKVPIDEVLLESRLGSIVPDIIIISSGKSLIIEIKVTHGVSSEKAHKIRQLNIPAVEVIAGHLLKKLYLEKKYHLNDNEYKRFLIEESGYKYWVHNPKGELKIKKIKNELKNYCDEKEVKCLKFKASNFDFYYGGGNDEMHYVEDCPIGKNIWKGGRNKGKSYAKYYEDCCYCKFNPDSGHGSQFQQKVNCGGGILGFNNLIKSLS